ncbi:unnamed protein product [Camellia sinensis]
MRFSWSSCQPVLLHVAMTSTCWKFQTHIFYLAVLLSQLQRLFTEFQIFYNCNGEAMCYSFLQVIWTTSGANHGPPGKHLLTCNFQVLVVFELY